MDLPKPVFKIVIVHEDTVAALQAAGVLKQVAAHLESRLGMDVNPWEICSHVWHFEWLLDPRLYEQAVSESIMADMIIISTDANAELPAAVRGWIESVLPLKQGAAVALVALLGGQRETRFASLPPARYLRQLANQYNADFLCNAPDEKPQVQSGMESILSRYEDDSAFAQASIPHSSDLRGWGLND